LYFLGTAFEGIIDKNFYTMAGDRIYDMALYLGDKDLSFIWNEWNETRSNFQIGFFIMDSLIEENLEILSSGSLLAAAISFFKSSREAEDDRA
jgi:hypothetical protein